MKFFDKKILPAIGLLLLAACTDPDAEIKELNTNELNDVIDTLYIESKQGESSDTDTPQIASQESLEPSSTQTVVEAATETTTSLIENQTIANDSATNNTPPTEQESTSSRPKESESVAENTDTIESAASSSESEQEAASINDSNSNSDELTDTTTVAKSSLTETTDTDAEKIASTSFSKPTTTSETLSDIVLKELLAKYPTIDYSNSFTNSEETQTIDTYCTAISERLSSVSKKGCLASNHRLSPFKTVKGNPIVVTEFAPIEGRKPLGKILVIGGTHGDELTSVSTAYKWISNLNRFHSGLFHWHLAPALNADAILKRPATRPNTNGVDINRNLPTPDWGKQSALRWEKLSKNSRKNPGKSAASEPETQWIMHEIATFKPDAIVSIHAPYGILDFDSPQLNNAPKNFGRLQLNLLGTYPGSLGNYAGIQRKIPVLTLELPNATAMPSQKELAAIWADMIKWLRVQLSAS